MRWFREPWPWLLMAGPFVVVVASVASAWIAFASDDGVVAEDYYKRGLLINRRLAAIGPERVHEPAATIMLGSDGEVRVHLDEGPPPGHLRLVLARPGEHDARVVVLSPAEHGEWVGRDTSLGPGRLIVKLESDRGQFPLTTTAARPSQLRLGAGGS